MAEEGNSFGNIDDLLKGLEGDVGKALDSFESEKPEETKPEYNQEPVREEQGGPRDITVDYYVDGGAKFLNILVYQSRHSSHTSAYTPDAITHSRVTQLIFKNIPDFAVFEKDLFEQVQHRWDAPTKEEVHSIGPADDSSRIRKNQYQIEETRELQKRMAIELTGINDYMMGKYNPGQ